MNRRLHSRFYYMDGYWNYSIEPEVKNVITIYYTKNLGNIQALQQQIPLHNETNDILNTHFLRVILRP